LRQQGEAPVVDCETVLRAVALDLAPLIAERQLDFDLQAGPALVRAHEWSLRELVRNLLHNAVRHSPKGARLSVSIQPQGTKAHLLIRDAGSGISEAMRQRLFQPFATGDTKSGTGLGLTIAREIVLALGGTIQLNNRLQGETIDGLDTCVWLPLQPTNHTL
jgi:two-component system sensor histidine kinase TctE